MLLKKVEEHLSWTDYMYPTSSVNKQQQPCPAPKIKTTCLLLQPHFLELPIMPALLSMLIPQENAPIKIMSA